MAASVDPPPSRLDRRQALRLFGGAGLVVLGACGSSGGSSDATAGAGGVSGTGDAGAAGVIPAETAGPFPGDGSNGPDILLEEGVVRRDITSSIGSASGVAEGVPLTVELVVVGAADGAPRPGSAIYAWHCDRDGGYSMYTAGLEGENYLRGVQEADADGLLAFDTIFPGTYPGRWPHIHFDVYPTLAEATSSAEPAVTSQLALPEDACRSAYEAAGYAGSVGNLDQLSLERDGVFADGVDQQLATVTGTVDDGFVATLTVPIA